MAEKPIITEETPPDAIERDIARTRREISGTITEIEERLSSGHMKWLAKERLRRAARSVAARGNEIAGKVSDTAWRIGQAAQDSGSRAKDRVVQFMKDDPVAVNVAAFELGALLVIVWEGLNKRKMKREFLREKRAEEMILAGQQPVEMEVQIRHEEFKKAA